MNPSSDQRPPRSVATRPTVRHPFALSALALAALTFAGVETGPLAAPAGNLVAIEFREAPISDLQVSGGYLGVPDSTGSFPERYRRFDPATGVTAPIGDGYGNLLVFRNLTPGKYRVALFHLEQTKTFKRLMPKEAKQLATDVCLVYGDSASALTFTVGPTDLKHLGRVTRKTRPTTADSTGAELWATTIEWSSGEERKAWKDLIKRKDLADWHERLEQRAGELEAAEKASKKGKN